MVPRLASVPHKPPKTIGHCRSKWLELYFRLLLSESLSSQSHWYPFWNSDIPTLQSALKQSYTEDTNCENNDDKTKKPTLGSLSISVNYCNILAYFHITHNKFKAALTVLSMEGLCCWGGWLRYLMPLWVLKGYVLASIIQGIIVPLYTGVLAKIPLTVRLQGCYNNVSHCQSFWVPFSELDGAIVKGAWHATLQPNSLPTTYHAYVVQTQPSDLQHSRVQYSFEASL